LKKLAIITTHIIQYQIPLFKELKKKNIDTSVFFASNHGLKKSYRDPEFLVKFNWNSYTNLLKGFKSFFPKVQKFKINDFRLSFDGIEEKLKNGKFDAIFILGWNNFHYLNAIRIAKKYNIKIIFRCENNLKATNNFFIKLLKKILLRLLFKKFKYFLSIGKLNNNFYLHHKVDKSKILQAPYFVDNKFFKVGIKKKKIKKRLNLSYKKIILFVGKLNERKRPFDFINLAKINKKNKNLFFLMIGDGKLKKKCLEKIDKDKIKNILLKGFVNQKELREIYKISDLYIQTSSYETWGLTINEAMASGTPVLCTKSCGAYYDLIKNRNTGMSYESANISELNKKMNFMIKNSHEFKKSIIKEVISHFTVKKTVSSIKKIMYEK
tara:strand:- start:2946 stop:4088 length:1143 start_codon:yes stop_codon:yes gene_type:complete